MRLASIAWDPPRTMTDRIAKALLPAGLNDVLPPDAGHEASVVEQLIAVLTASGYDRVKPPLIEFEGSLLNGPGAAVADQTFRVMDPVSQRMMGVRADMTLQVARIATTRLSGAPRPLRLAYSGPVLRVKGSQLRPERQFTQVGGELIGSLAPAADAEIVRLAASALTGIGARNISVDLNVPTLVPAVCRALGLPAGETEALRAALDRRDAAAVAAVGGPAADILGQLLAATGNAGPALQRLAAIALPAPAEPDRRRLIEVVRLIREADPDLMVTVDPVERRGFEYQTGVSFTLFARGVRGELGRGGRYRAGVVLRPPPIMPEPLRAEPALSGADARRTSRDIAEDAAQPGEPATGFTLYMDTVLRAVPGPEVPARLYLPHGTPAGDAARLRADGWITVSGLEPVADEVVEARRLACGHVLTDGVVRPVD